MKKIVILLSMALCSLSIAHGQVFTPLPLFAKNSYVTPVKMPLATNDKIVAINAALDAARVQTTAYKAAKPQGKRYAKARKTKRHSKGKRSLISTPNTPSFDSDDTQGWNIEYVAAKK